MVYDYHFMLSADKDFQRDLSRFETRSEDIYVVSFPKSGKALDQEWITLIMASSTRLKFYATNNYAWNLSQSSVRSLYMFTTERINAYNEEQFSQLTD